MKAGPANLSSEDLLVANLAHRRVVDQSAVATTGRKHLLSLGGVYAQSRATRATLGPAFMLREVSWPRSAET